MPNNEDGQCLPLKRCPMLNQLINKKRMTIVDRQILMRSKCGYIGRSPLVCCQLQNENITTRLNGSPLQIEDLPVDCGRIQSHHDLTTDFIVGGEESRIFDSPWLALLQCMCLSIECIHNFYR